MRPLRVSPLAMMAIQWVMADKNPPAKERLLLIVSAAGLPPSVATACPGIERVCSSAHLSMTSSYERCRPDSDVRCRALGAGAKGF